MKFGVVYPGKGEFVDSQLAVECAREAERQGFEFFLTWDHYVYPDTPRSFEAWVLLAYIAASTSKIRLGTCVTALPFRPPGQLAKVVATLDNLSNGRVSLGVGAGWYEPEFDAFSDWDAAGTRVSKTKEALQLMTQLWTGSPVNFRGKHYHAKAAVLDPRPIQSPHPPLWFGGTGDRMLRLAAQYGDVWIPTTNMLSRVDYGTCIARLSKLRSSLGQRSLTYAYNLFTPFRTAEEYAASIESFAKLGCEYYLVNWSYEKKESLSRLAWFASEVMPSFG